MRSASKTRRVAVLLSGLGLVGACTAPPDASEQDEVPTTTVATSEEPTGTETEWVELVDEAAPSTVTAATPSATPTTLGPVPHWDRSVVRIRVVTCGGVGTGTGFVIDGTTIITARHVVEGASKIQVATWDGRDLAVAAAYEVGLVDLGIITLSEPTDLAPLGISKTDPVADDDVAAVGYPEGDELLTTSGEVFGYFEDVDFGSLGRIMRFTAPIKPGNSGGPLLSTDGDVVGVVYAVDLHNGDSLAVPAAALRRLVDGGFRSTVVEPC